jgi:hypothetical protein
LGRFTVLLTLVALAAAAPADSLADTAYPRQFESAAGAVTIEAPVIRDWTRFRVLSGFLPFRAMPSGGSATVSGQAHFETGTVIDFERRQVELVDTRIVSLETESGASPAGLEPLLVEAISAGGNRVSLDRVLQALPEDFEIPAEAGVRQQLNFNPPRIVVSSRPTQLMLIDGPPSYVPIPSTGLEFVVNTDWDIFRSREENAWYLLDNGFWLTNSMLSSGDWLRTTRLPRDFLTLQVNSDWPQVAEAMPPRRAEADPLPIVISYEPTELVLVDGQMKLEPIGDGGLQFVSNTSSELFYYDGRYYFLASGRWFRTKDVRRKWYAVRALPAVFADIPSDHPRAHVRASVPGTPEARLANIEAALPRMARVRVGGSQGIEVPYLGQPSFVEIPGTPLRRAENTPYQVIAHNNFYYLCHEGAWYASPSPQGPWDAAREIPEAIYTIPPSDPAYNVTFVRLESFDDSSGQVAYSSTSGYYGRYYTGSTMVYGTGWYYPGYYDRPVYWRYPYTYGYGWRYGPWGPYWPHGYTHSATFDLDRGEKDWEWSLDGSKRRVYDYGPTNYIGSGTYVMPKSNIHTGDGK